MNRTTRVLATLTGAVTGAGLLIAAAPAGAADAGGIEVHKRGTCTMGSTWELDLEKEHGLIEVDFDAETRRASSTWKVKIKHKRVANGKKWVYRDRTVSDLKGEVEVDRDLRDRKGPDRIVVRIKDPATGEVCRGAARI